LPGVLLLWIYVVAFAAASAAAEAPVPIERTVKAAFVYKFLSFVEWPADIFTAADSPLIIGVYNADDIAAELAPMVRDRLVGSHPVEVKPLRDSDSLHGVHVLFIGKIDSVRLSRLTRLAQQQSTLTIAESEGALDAGAVINLVIVDGRVRFEVALNHAERSRWKLSSRLLALAHSVRNAGMP
jgi:hypothetical protein